MLEKIPMAASSNRLRMLLVLGDPGPGVHGELLAHIRAFLGRDKDGCCSPLSSEQPIASRHGACLMDRMADGVTMLRQYHVVAVAAVIADREHLPAGNHVRPFRQAGEIAPSSPAPGRMGRLDPTGVIVAV